MFFQVMIAPQDDVHDKYYVSGLAMLSHYYSNDKERGNKMAIAFGGTGLGVLIAPTFGAFFYEYFGKPVPFLIIAGLALIDGCKCFHVFERDSGVNFYKKSFILESRSTL
jgi:MFS family permease